MEKCIAVVTPLADEGLRLLLEEKAGELGYTVLFPQGEEARRAAMERAEIVCGYGGEFLGQAKNLKWFCSFSAGMESFLEPGFLPEEVLLSNSSGAYGVTICEHIVMVSLELLRRREEYRQIVARRQWRRDLAIRSLWGSRITILGTGDIGQETARRLRAFGPKNIVGCNRRGRNPQGLFDAIVGQGELDSVLPQTDLLILCLPDTRETRGILSRQRLALLPSGALVVNVGRGGAMDQEALEELLRSGKLGGAALDVFAEEPIPGDSSLWDCPGLLITPHISGNNSLAYTNEKIVELFLEDLENYRDGRPLKRQVLRRVGY